MSSSNGLPPIQIHSPKKSATGHLIAGWCALIGSLIMFGLTLYHIFTTR